MAKKGIQYCVFGELNESDGTYSKGKYLSPVAAFNGSPNNSDAKDYGDDRCVEVAKETTGCALSVELNNDEDDIYAFLLGHEKGEDGEIVHNVDDEAPYVGVGAVGKSGSKYVVRFYKKVMFAEPNDENATKQESTAFGHVTLEGDAIPMEDGSWKIRKTFDTLAAAKTWLNSKVGITTSGS